MLPTVIFKMKRILLFFTVLFVAGALVVGTGQATFKAGPFKWRSKPNKAFSPGEILVFEVGWKAASAGEIRLSVNEIGYRKKRPAYRLVCEAATNRAIDTIFKVRDSFESWMDVQSLCSVGFRRKIQEGSYEKIEEFFLDPASGKYHGRSARPSKNATANLESGRIPEFVQDVVSTLYYVRTQPLRVGQVVNVSVMNGVDVHDIQFNIRKKETVKTGAGEFNCVVLEPLFKIDRVFRPHSKATATVWLTDDEKHLPVKITAELPFGHIDASLSQILSHGFQ